MKLEERKLGEFIESISDTTKVLSEKVILINTSDVENGKVLNHQYVVNKNLRGQFKKRFKKDDILYSEIRPKNKRFAYVDFESDKYIASTKLMVLRNKGNIDNGFLFQLLKSDKMINYLQMIAESRSGTFPQITFNELSNVSVLIPEMSNQKKIAKILEMIDKKIELNNHTNDNLHEIGLLLVENYIDIINSKIELNKIIKFIKGKKPYDITSEHVDNYEKYLTIACLNGQELNYADSNKMIIADNDLLMVMDGASSGDVYYSNYGIVGSTLAKIEIINDNYNKTYIYFIIKKYNDLIKSKNTGSAIPHTDKVFVGNLVIPEIDLKEQIKFEILLDKIQQNQKENETLIKLRDTLLPKLMNGEIDLDKIEI